MKLRRAIQLFLILSIVMLCAGFGVYSFLQLNSVENRQDFNLYTLVPQDAIAVLETDRMADLVEDINRLSSSKDNHFLYVSELFSYLKNYLQTLVQDTPHGLSKQMNKMLISFHEPDTSTNQVLYCNLGADDHELIETFVRKYCSSVFPAKYFDYKGEEIRIYPMVDGRFLAMYLTADYFVASFQKWLVEDVIDALRDKKSLMNLPLFRAMRADKRRHEAAMVYARMNAVDMGRPTDSIHAQAHLGSWVEFDLKFNENAVYCSGMIHEVDSTYCLMNALRAQKPIEGFPDAYLPASTFFYNRWAISDKDLIFKITTCQEYAKAVRPDNAGQCDEEWMSFLNDFADQSAMSCLFLPKDTSDITPCVVVRIPLKDEPAAERRLHAWLSAGPKGKDVSLVSRISLVAGASPAARTYKKYALSPNTLLSQMTGITESALHSIACLYQGSLLLAPDERSLSAYISAVEGGEVLDGMPMYEESIGSLSPVYHFVMMADMETALHQPEAYVRLIPGFFFRYAEFFRHFMFAVQFTCTDRVVYPHIVLLYKG